MYRIKKRICYENNREIMSNSSKSCAHFSQANKWNFLNSQKPPEGFLLPSPSAK